MPKLKVFLACPGLGHVRRGFESFTRECFDAISSNTELDLFLFSANGAIGEHERAVGSLKRTGIAAKALGTLIRKTPYYIEQATFALGLIPHLRRIDPDVVYFSDGTLGNALWHWRKKSGARFKLLLSNGAPFEEGFERWDHVQQLTPHALEKALMRGVPENKQTLLPYGIEMKDGAAVVPRHERLALRRELGLPESRPIILSVGTVNRSHKRMDYVIRETAALSAPRPYLVLAGQTDEETPLVVMLGDELLGADNFCVRSVPREQMADYYQAADGMVLASLNEGFGRVLLEAGAVGLPCLTHDYAVPRYILGNYGRYADFAKNGALTELLRPLVNATGETRRPELGQDIYRRFSWDSLRTQYVSMLLNAR